MIKVLEKLYNDKVILDHGMVVGKELANVLSGGDTTIDKTLSEDKTVMAETNSTRSATLLAGILIILFPLPFDSLGSSEIGNINILPSLLTEITQSFL